MSRLEGFANAAQAVLVTSAVASLHFAERYMQQQVDPSTPVQKAVIAGFLLFFLFMIIQMTRVFVKRTIENSEWLREMVMGKDFIEGTWKNVVRSPGRETQWSGGIVVICMVCGQYRVRGETFNEGGVRVGIFNSVIAELSECDGVLRYLFVKTDITSDRSSWDGYSEYQFNTVGQRRKIFDGIYVRRGDTQEHRLRGELIVQKEEIERTETEEGRREIVLEYIARERRLSKQVSLPNLQQIS